MFLKIVCSLYNKNKKKEEENKRREKEKKETGNDSFGQI